jgi:AcrR family transcriptional regulator
MSVEADRAERPKGFRRTVVEGEILERAAQLFAEHGYAATSMQDIAAALGVSRSSLYHYFPNKEDLLARLVSDLVTSSEVALQQVKRAEARDAVARLQVVISALLGPILEAPSRFRLLLTVEAELPATIAERWRTTRRSIVAEVAALIRAGIADGQFRAVDEQIATFTLLGMCNWVAWWPARQRENVDALTTGISDMAVAALTVGGDHAEPRTAEGALKIAREQLDQLESLMRPPQRDRARG